MKVTELFTFVVLIIVVFQWIHPTTLLQLEGKATKKSLVFTYSIGLGCIISFIILLILLLNLGSNSVLVVLFGLILILVCLNNIVISIRAIFLLGSTKIREKSYLLVTTFTSLLFITLIFYISYGSSMDSSSLLSLGIFQFKEKSILFITMILRISLFVLVTFSAYIFLVYYTVNSFRSKKYTSDQNQRYIEDLFKSNTKWLVILVGVFLSFFHFAEIDTLQLPESYRNYFQPTFKIFQLIASALFIPILLKNILEPKRSDKIIFEILEELKQVSNETEVNESILLTLTNIEISLNKIADNTEKKLTTPKKSGVNKKGKGRE